MKKELNLVLKNTQLAFTTLEELRKEGFNATVVTSESLRHAVDYYPEEHHFFTLRQFEKKQFLESILCIFIVDEKDVSHIKDVIRRYTNNFKDVKGFMFTRDILDYEGSI